MNLIKNKFPLFSIGCLCLKKKPIHRQFYAPHKKVYPRAIDGMFNRWRWVMVWITQLVFYGLPWLQWGERQMVLFDLGARRFYLFGLVLYPQDFIYLTGLLILSALSLFLFTAVAGRLWCGFTCPQTVYTEIFMWLENRIEGDRSARMRLDKGGVDVAREALAKKGLKQLAWVSVALWTGLPLSAFCAHSPLGPKFCSGRAAGSCFGCFSTRLPPTVLPALCASRCANTCALRPLSKRHV